MADGAIVPPGCIDDVECLKEYGSLHYIPSTAGNALFLGIFGAALIAQLYLGIRHKTWGYMAAMVGGTLLEIVGYAGRLMIIDDIFNENNFIIYLIGLTIGPAFYSAAVYLCFSRIVNVYGNTLSLLRPKIVTIIFISGDFISLVLQAAGGALASVAETQEDNDMGVNIMIAGLATQVAATTIFAGFCLHLIWAIRKYPNRVLQETIQFRRTLRFRAFLAAIAIATVAILIRCAFRCAELSQGFDGKLANDEVTFMILDGLMMIITVFVLTAAHPAITLGDRWNIGKFWSKDDSTSSYAMVNKEANGSDSNMSDQQRRALV